MPLSPTETETLWIDGWEALYGHLRAGRARIVDEAWAELRLEQAQGAIQQAAWRGQRAVFEEVWLRGRPAVRLGFVPAEATTEPPLVTARRRE